MLPLEISPATVIIGLVIAVLAVLAVRRLVRRGTCDCHDHGGGPAKGGCAAGGCAGCTGAESQMPWSPTLSAPPSREALGRRSAGAGRREIQYMEEL